MNKRKIVVIDDNLDVRENTKEILELADYEVYAAEDGKMGVEMVKNKKPDLILCDILMPKLDGYGVLKILSKNPTTSKIPFIFVSALSEAEEVRKGMNQGADDYITKPYNDTQLLEAIEARLHRSTDLKREFLDEDESDALLIEQDVHDELTKLSEGKKIQFYKKKDIIFREDDFANYLYYILKGRVKTVRTDFYGHQFINDIYCKGDFMGHLSLLENKEFKEMAQAIESVEVAVIPKADFLNLIRQNHILSLHFIQFLARKVRRKEDRLFKMAYSPVAERVADVLLKLKGMETCVDGTSVKLLISREDLASIVGTSKESLIRTLSDMKHQNLIQTEGQQITILSEKGLKKIVEGF